MVEAAPAHSPELERTLSLHKELESTELAITHLRNQFLQKDFSGLSDSALSSNPTNPQIVAQDVLAQQVIEFVFSASYFWLTRTLVVVS
jgi:hypothetical protein